MGYKMRRDLREVLDPEIKGLPRAVALEIADDAREETRLSYASLEDLRRWTAAKNTDSVRESLKRLAGAGWEFRVPIGKGKDGRLLYAMPGTRMIFRVPDFEGRVTTRPKGESPLALEGEGRVTTPSEGVTTPSEGVTTPSEGVTTPPFSSTSSTSSAPHSSKSEPASSKQQTGTQRADPIPADAPHLDDVETVCNHLADAIQKATGDRPKITKRDWRDPARLLLDADGRTLDQVLAAIDWAHGDDFWQGVITDPKTLRKNYSKLRQKAAAEQRKANGSQQRGGAAAPIPSHDDFNNGKVQINL